MGHFFAGRMHKMKASDLRGMQYHNQRERASKTNTDIDKKRSHLNYDLVNRVPIDYKERIQKRIEEGVKSKRKIRKDAVLCNQWIITSDKDFFKGLSEKEERRFFREAYDWFCRRYGKENIPFAVVHRDEGTPHMHLGVIPIIDGRLSSKRLFNPKELRYVQEEFPKYMRSKGFYLERGIPNKQKHIEPVKYKNKKMIELGEKIERWLEDQVRKIKQIQGMGKRIDEIEVKEKGMFRKDRVEISRDDWEFVKKEARRVGILELELERTREKMGILVHQNEMLKGDREKARKYDKLCRLFGRDRLEKALEQQQEKTRTRTKERSKERDMSLDLER